MSLLSKGRVVSSHIFIILLNKWIYPAHKLTNAFSPCSTCWHFPADGSAEGETRKVVRDKGQACLVIVCHHSDTGLLASLARSVSLLGSQGLETEGWGGDRKEGKPAWSSSILNLFVPLWVGEEISLIFFPFGIISPSLSTDDFFLISWGQAIGSANTQILVSGKLETGFRKNRWVEWGWSLLKIISRWIQSWVNQPLVTHTFAGPLWMTNSLFTGTGRGSVWVVWYFRVLRGEGSFRYLGLRSVCLEAEDLHRRLWSLGVAQLPPKGVVSEEPGVWLRSWVEDCGLCLCVLEPPPGAGSESVWQIRTFRMAGQDLLGLPSCVNINPIHLSTHLLIVSLLKMFNVKITFEIKDVSKIMDLVYT